MSEFDFENWSIEKVKRFALSVMEQRDKHYARALLAEQQLAELRTKAEGRLSELKTAIRAFLEYMESVNHGDGK